MGHGRLTGVLVAAAVLTASVGLTAAPASAAAPTTVPNMTAPTALSTVAGDVTVSALTSVSTPLVQFYWNDTQPIGDPVAVDINGNASVTWPTWSLADGTTYTVTAADCNSDGCNAMKALAVQVTIDNTPPTITAPVAGSVSGDVTVSATATSPLVQFYLDTVAFGAPVAVSSGSASATWNTKPLPDAAHSWTAAECDAQGCNPARSTPPVDVTIANAPALTPVNGSSVSGVVHVTAATTAPLVQFTLGGVAFGAPVPVSAGSASVDWTTWDLASGPYTWTATGCDGGGCNAAIATVQLTLANSPPTLSPADGSTVSGNVVITADTDAPLVQFSLDSTPFGAPVATVQEGAPTKVATVQWHTWSLPDGQHTWSAAECDANGCNPASSSVTFTISNPAPVLAPADGSTVSGVVPVTATTAAPFVQFALDGVAFGAPVAVSGGSAPVHWTTWGLANGPYTWTATACDSLGCNAAIATVHLTLANAAPAITAPKDGAEANASAEIDATAPGGGLAFFIDGAQVGFVSAAPYTLIVASPLGFGSHTASVTECDSTGVTCNGPSSPTVTFVVGKLGVSVVSVAPNPFSPNKDGHRDRTAFRVHISTPQRITYAVRDMNGHTVLGPRSSARALAAGSYNFTWDGHGNSGKLASDGMYSIVVATSSGTGNATMHGTATAKVHVDHTPTRFFAIRGNQATLYPVRDGFLDTFNPSVQVTEGGRLSLAISKPNGQRVKLIGLTHAAKGTFRLTWNGRNAGNVLMPAGNYRFRFFALDRAGNESTSRLLLVHLSHRRATRKSVIVTRTGDAGRPSATASCTLYSLGLSSFRHGLWLDNSCDRGFDGLQHIYADYVMSVPGSAQYDSMRVMTVGQTIHSPEPISAFIYNFTESKWDPAGSMSLGKSKPRVTTFRTLSGAHHVSLRHKVKIRIAVPDMVTPEDYDVASASIVVTYRVLQ